MVNPFRPESLERNTITISRSHTNIFDIFMTFLINAIVYYFTNTWLNQALFRNIQRESIV